mmetsp:Transcript_27752/g.31907  ORF Transcript_27752/g.31907 Transcript_27752/m.31907 type:complete len:176 (+) Transcript_27752:48-575(+)
MSAEDDQHQDPRFELNMKEALDKYMQRKKLDEEEYGPFRQIFENAKDFFAAVDFSEPFVIGLITFHIIICIVLWKTRKNLTVQMGFQLCLLGLCQCTEYINSFLSQHWELLAGQNYFDESGFFLSMTFQLPLLMMALYVTVNAIYNAGSMLIKYKRLQIRKELAEKHKTQAGATD